MFDRALSCLQQSFISIKDVICLKRSMANSYGSYTCFLYSPDKEQPEMEQLYPTKKYASGFNIDLDKPD